MQDSYRIVLSFMQVVICTTRKLATLGPLELRPTFVKRNNTGHISVLNERHLWLNLVYLLYSRLIDVIVIPRLDKWHAKFFTHLSYEQGCYSENHQPLSECTMIKIINSILVDEDDLQLFIWAIYMATIRNIILCVYYRWSTIRNRIQFFLR